MVLQYISHTFWLAGMVLQYISYTIWRAEMVLQYILCTIWLAGMVLQYILYTIWRARMVLKYILYAIWRAETYRRSRVIGVLLPKEGLSKEKIVVVFDEKEGWFVVRYVVLLQSDLTNVCYF